MSASILVVDDDRSLLELLTMRLDSAGYRVVPAYGERDAINAAKERAIDLAIIDLQLADTTGVALMERLRSIGFSSPVIILTAHGTIDSAVEAVKRGAFNYLTKPFDAANLLLQVEKALDQSRFDAEFDRLQRLGEGQTKFSDIVTRSESMQKVLSEIGRVAASDSTVYICGESGTGKELVARAIHNRSPRKDKPFEGVNCAAIPETLMESELFGHVKGAFTGAGQSAKGRFAQADGGTIFLDEIGDMPLSVQAKLLRVLQERQYYAVGSEGPTKVDARVVVATNKDLEAEVRMGRFREDLFYRIHVIPIVLPPLRERRDDIPLLAAHLLRKACKRMEKEVKGLTPDAMQKLLMHDWPGNVRELENTIEYAVAMARDKVIGADLVLRWKDSADGAMMTLKDAKDAFEKKYLMEVLRLASGNVSKAAVLAGKYRPDFYNLLKKYNLRPEEFKKQGIS